MKTGRKEGRKLGAEEERSDGKGKENEGKRKHVSQGKEGR